MINSLPRRIVVWHVAVIAISLVVAGIVFVYRYLGDYHEKLVVNRLTDYAMVLLPIVETTQNVGIGSDWLSRFADEADTRVLITDADGRVLLDTHDPNRRDIERVVLRTGTLVANKNVNFLPKDAFSGELRTASGREYYYVAAMTRPDQFGRWPYGTAVVVMQPSQTLVQGLIQIAPALGWAGVIALLASAPLAAFLAKSISRPVRLMTRASEEMARGRYDQTVPVTSDDELGRLAASFNTMAREVDRTNRTLRDLIGNVSHELKTPLTSIQGFAQALLDGAADSPEDRQRAISIIHEEANRMRRLVDDLLYISRLESGQIKLRREPVDLHALLRDVARRLTWQIETKGIALRYDAAAGAAVLGDGHRLEGVFGNLLDNAVRHTPEGGVITVSTRPIPAAGAFEVVVHNTGSFIPAAEQPRIFERFYQVDRSRAQTGFGLGLSIVKEVVQAHGGAITVASDRDTGTTFTVTLPAAPAEPAFAEPARRAPEPVRPLP